MVAWLTHLTKLAVLSVWVVHLLLHKEIMTKLIFKTEPKLRQCDSPSTFYKFIIIIIDNIIIGIIIINSPDVVPCHRLGLQASPAWKPIAGGPTGLRKAPGCHWSWRWRWSSSWWRWRWLKRLDQCQYPYHPLPQDIIIIWSYDQYIIIRTSWDHHMTQWWFTWPMFSWGTTGAGEGWLAIATGTWVLSKFISETQCNTDAILCDYICINNSKVHKKSDDAIAM